MVDLFLLLLLPSGGDELQGIKKGIVELADLVVINKADGELIAAAKRAQSEYQSAINLAAPGPGTLAAAGLVLFRRNRRWDRRGLAFGRRPFRAAQVEAKAFDAKRARQALAWMWSEVNETLAAALKAHPGVAERIEALGGRRAGRRNGAVSGRKGAAQGFLGRRLGPERAKTEVETPPFRLDPHRASGLETSPRPAVT